HFYYVDSLGVNYNYRFSSSKVGLNYQYTPNSNVRANIGFAVQPLKLVGNLPAEDLIYSYRNVNLVPTAGFKWRINKEIDWSIDYRGKNNQPNFLHIIPVRDNSNSQNIIVGNPELKAEFSNRISTTFRKFITARSQYFETNFAYNFVSNKIVSDKKAYTTSTIQETTFKNADGYYDLKWYYLFNTPIFNESLQLDLVGSADFYNNLSYVNDERNKTEQFIYSQSLQFRYNWSDYFETLFNTNYLLNHASYTWPYATEITAHSLLFSAGTKGYLSDYITLGAEMSQRFNSGYESSFMNSNPTIINAYMEFSFFNNKAAVLRIQGFDLLDQNKNMGTYSEYIGNDLYEAKNNRLGRYFMVTLNVRLQKYPKKK
ncbi:MAG: outer membrane beta-barrel protein, partial [Sphingobacterium sp.]